MDNNPLPDSLRQTVENAIRTTLDNVLREAFAAGYLQGADDVAQRVVAATKGAAKAPAGAAAESPSRLSERTRPQEAALPAQPKAAVREVHPNSADARRFPYGAVANAFRTALREAGVFGTTREDLVARVSEILEADVSKMDHRDTLKRLKRADELRINEGRYFAGPALVGRNENGALNGKPASAPEADEAVTSSNES